MEMAHSFWKKQLDAIDRAAGAIPSIAPSVGVRESFAPAVRVLFDAVVGEVQSYRGIAQELRDWMDVPGRPELDAAELEKRVRPTLRAARRLKALIDAYNRERAVAGLIYEDAGGKLAAPDENPSPREQPAAT